MALLPLTAENEISNAYNVFLDRITSGKQKLPANIGFLGGNLQADVYWDEELGFWSCFGTEENYYWSAFGTENPLSQRNLSIICQINFPYEGINRRVAGAFARDAAGHIYLTHSGKIGGGREGIGKEAFWSHYGGEGIEVVQWPDGRSTNAVIISDLDSPTVPEHVSKFIFAVRDFKASVQASKAGRPATTVEPKLPPMTPAEVAKFPNDFSVLQQSAEDTVQRAIPLAADFNMFKILDVAQKEQSISRFLSALLDSSGTHGQGPLFLEAFLSLPAIGFDNREISVGTWRIEKEKAISEGRLDIVMSNFLTKHLIVIENKIASGDQPDQLARYRRWLDSQAHFNDANRRKLIYLTPDGREAQNQSGTGVSYERISYEKDIIGWLKQCMDKIQTPHVLASLEQFLRIIESLSKSDDGMPQYKRELAAFLAQPQNFQMTARISEVFPCVVEKLLIDFWKKLWDILNERLLTKGFAKEWVLTDPPFGDDFLKEGAGMSIEHQGTQTSRYPQLSFRVDHYEDKISYGLMWNRQLPIDEAPMRKISKLIQELVSSEDFLEWEDEYPVYRLPYEANLRSADALLSMSRGEKAVQIADEFWHFFMTRHEEIGEINRSIGS